MPRVRGPGGGRLRSGSGARYRCDSCPCSVDACSHCPSGVPSTFNVTIQLMDNGSCADCETIIEGEYPVTYAGTVNCSGNDWHYWTSVADVFGSPGNCSGIFDDKMVVVLIRESGGSCSVWVRVIPDSISVCTAISGSIASYSFDGTTGGIASDFCAAPYGVHASAAFNAGHCGFTFDFFNPNFILFS